ncbi:hypothetical protein [Kibdelosporangium phytohabitans]|uniref:HEAT repeat domain-containing protein n=1 Tax=Kibdelosporangium phytohabitans TaxID=860235 RepID=A0A0N9HND5_9PSEU|nr:hypothetical protein [Kibdelosporangium phytohabitans]ALG08451.1 hypothetical protein AOZ06_17390 [Kibdelosporangium phytohabitans]MBE1470492.1 hypothetical protein [Kibdelosporangium phytohabitans]
MITREEPVDWSQLHHAYGPADDVPPLLEQLRGEDWEEALGELFGSILHQGSIYPATVAALPSIVAIARDPGAEGRVGALWLVGTYAESVAMGAGRATMYLPDGVDVDVFDRESSAARDKAALDVLPLMEDPDPGVREAVYGCVAHLADTAVAGEVVAALRARLDREDVAAVALMEPLLRLGAFDDGDFAAVVARGDEAVVFAAAWSAVAVGRDLPGVVDHLAQLWPDHAHQYPTGNASSSLSLLGAHALPVLRRLQTMRTAKADDLVSGWVALAAVSRSSAPHALQGLLDLPDETHPVRLVQALTQVVADVPERADEVCDAIARISEPGDADPALLANAAVALFSNQDPRWAARASAVVAMSAEEPRIADATSTMPFSLILLGFPAHRRDTAWAANELSELAAAAVAAWPQTPGGWIDVLAELPASEAVVRAALPAVNHPSTWKLLARIALDHPELGSLIEPALDTELTDDEATAWRETTRALVGHGVGFEHVWQLSGGDARLLAVWTRRPSPATHAACLQLLDGTAHVSFGARHCQLVAARAVTEAGEAARAWPTVRAIVDTAGAPLVDGIEVGNQIVALDDSRHTEWIDLLRDIAYNGRHDWSGTDHWAGAVAVEALQNLGEIPADEAADRMVDLLLAAIPLHQAPRVAPVAGRVLRTVLVTRPDLRDRFSRQLDPVLDGDGRVATASGGIADDRRFRDALRGVSR